MADSRRPVEMAPEMGEPVMPQGVVPVVTTVYLDHTSGRSEDQEKANATDADRFFPGHSMNVHNIGRHNWAISRTIDPTQHVHHTYSTGAGGSSMPSIIIVGDYNGLLRSDATDTEQYNVFGVAQNAFQVTGTEAGSAKFASTPDGAMTVMTSGLATVQCISLETMQPGDMFGVKAPDSDAYLVKHPSGGGWVQKYAFPGQSIDKIIPVMYRISFKDMLRAVLAVTTNGDLFSPASLMTHAPLPLGDIAVVHGHVAGTKLYTKEVTKVPVVLAADFKGPVGAVKATDVDDYPLYREGSLQRRVQAITGIHPANLPELAILDNMVMVRAEATYLARGRPGVMANLIEQVVSSSHLDAKNLMHRDRMQGYLHSAVGMWNSFDEGARLTAADSSTVAAGSTQTVVTTVAMTAFQERVARQAKGRVLSAIPIGASWPAAWLF